MISLQKQTTMIQSILDKIKSHPTFFLIQEAVSLKTKEKKKDRNFRFMPTLNTTLCTSYSVQFLATNE